MSKPNRYSAAPDGHVWVVRGPNCWGRDKVLGKARQNARNALGLTGRVKWDEKVAPEDCQVSSFDGSISWSGHEDCPDCTVRGGWRRS